MARRTCLCSAAAGERGILQETGAEAVADIWRNSTPALRRAKLMTLLSEQPELMEAATEAQHCLTGTLRQEANAQRKCIMEVTAEAAAEVVVFKTQRRAAETLSMVAVAERLVHTEPKFPETAETAAHMVEAAVRITTVQPEQAAHTAAMAEEWRTVRQARA